MHSFALCFTLALIALFSLMPVGSSTVLFAFSLARSILRDRHHTKDCVEQGPKGFEFHRFPGKKVSGNTTIRKNEHLSCTKRASWRTDFAEDQEPQIPLLLIPVRKQKLSEPSTSRRQENPSETR
jgi:hypothetical protein